MKHLPKYPIYIPSKGRAGKHLTTRFLDRDGVPYRMVVEPQEADTYLKQYGAEHVLVLPFADRGLHETRNWIKDHSTVAGDEKHWQLDDNIRGIWRRYKGKRIPCRSGVALRVIEDFTDRYENIALAGMNYEMFGATYKAPPFYLNCHVYSCTLIMNQVQNRWRVRYNDDVDMCLQVLSDGWCTVLFNAFLIQKATTIDSLWWEHRRLQAEGWQAEDGQDSKPAVARSGAGKQKIPEATACGGVLLAEVRHPTQAEGWSEPGWGSR